MVSCAGHEAEVRSRTFIEDNTVKAVLKSKSAQKGAIELNYEIRLKDSDGDFITTLADMDGIGSAVLVSYNGDYLG